MKNFFQRLLCLCLFLAAPLSAQVLDLGVISGNEGSLPIAVVPMVYQGKLAAPDTQVADVIRADLNRSGQFRSMPEQSLIARPTRGSEVRFNDWRLAKQDFLVVGRVLDDAKGSYRIEYELYDVAKQERMLGLSLTSRAKGIRDVSHQIADQIYEKILGVRGAFWTRIAYVTANGVGKNIKYSLMVADSDGMNPQNVVTYSEPLLSPAWSPDGRKLAYVSFERGNSTIYIQELNTGAREMIASFKGINGAPAFSPDGRRMAMTLSKSGNPEIYVMDIASRSLTQVTNHYSIDTEAVWSADGQSLVFTSDRGGRPQLYQVSANGGEPRRLSFSGDSNAKASVSYDGKRIASAQGKGSVYRVSILDVASGSWQSLSPGNLDESPSFAPNASMLLYANKEGRRGVLYAVSADGRVRQRIVLADGDVREPAWGPFRQK
ncbi:MAG: Tol-Pal system beta propeller repeat protein TolB [Arenimonas sp.]